VYRFGTSGGKIKGQLANPRLPGKWLLNGVCSCAQVNDCHLCGLSRAEVAAALRDLPQHVRMVCARRKKMSSDDKMSTIERLWKAKSEQSLASASESASASLSRNKSRSLEQLTKYNIWSSEPTEVQLIKGDGTLGFSILDDPVCVKYAVVKQELCFRGLDHSQVL